MKLLDWMHQKIRRGQGGVIPFKDRNIGSCYTCITKHDEPKYVTYKTSYTSSWRETTDESEAGRDHAEHEMQDDTFAESPVIFDGFLSIGFLGLEPMISEPVTPTFLNEGQFPVTETELRFINEELEKFLENEDYEEINATESSGRNSQASVITLANMHIEEDNLQDPEEEQMTVCPLQNYLFGSTIELPQSGEGVKKRASLRELFHENELNEKSPADDCKGQNIKQHNKFTLLSIKKLLKKLKSPNPLRPASGEFAATSKKNKFNKILKMLRRKVHPEKNNETHYTAHSELDGKFYNSTNDEDLDTGEMHDLSSAATCAEIYKEQWIKTDTDYFVLEL